MDGDSDLDVLSASSYDNKIGWYENLIPHVEVPVFNPDEGEYISNTEIKVGCSNPETVIRYTTNGEKPTN